MLSNNFLWFTSGTHLSCPLSSISSNCFLSTMFSATEIFPGLSSLWITGICHLHYVFSCGSCGSWTLTVKTVQPTVRDNAAKGSHLSPFLSSILFFYWFILIIIYMFIWVIDWLIIYIADACSRLCHTSSSFSTFWSDCFLVFFASPWVSF